MKRGEASAIGVQHWAEDYLGRAWENGAEGPDAYDCWGLVRAVLRDRFGIALPAVNVDALAPLAVRRAFRDSGEYDHWQEIDAPVVEGDVVLMSHAKHVHHIGLWTAGGVLHAVEGAGVVHQHLQSLRMHGWNVVSVYRRKTA